MHCYYYIGVLDHLHILDDDINLSALENIVLKETDSRTLIGKAIEQIDFQNIVGNANFAMAA